MRNEVSSMTCEPDTSSGSQKHDATVAGSACQHMNPERRKKEQSETLLGVGGQFGGG